MYEHNRLLPTESTQFGLALPEQPINPTAVERATDRNVIWVPDAYGRGMVPVERELAPPLPARTAPRDLTPQPLIDARAQILVGGGACAAGVGWGAGQILNAFAGLGSGAVLALALLLIAAKMPRRPGSGGGRETHIHITNHNRLLGRSTTNL